MRPAISARACLVAMNRSSTNARLTGRLTVGKGDPVLKFQGWKAVVLLGTAMTLSACGGGGGGGSSGTADVRLANATTTHASIDLLSNGAKAVAATAIDSVSAYAGVPAAGP